MCCEFVFRHAGGCLIEIPDLDTPMGVRRCWVATLWHDPAARAITRLVWQPGERGWQLPVTMAVGDVIEFGVAVTDDGGNAHSTHWYGWLDHATDRALIVRGPYEHSGTAIEASRSLVDEIRLAQLAAPTSDAPAVTGGSRRV